ncbi:hypothetical protein YH63_003320 [Afipia massiliensis]|uniref:Zinc finger CCCH-type TRM13 domain-containing protein n=1 Tax=Afipia massiliensis TaxID=211460 RepID=A0A4U6BNG4_9BRAD|nr:hypothetical protein YH63_003320 [Afipia massiliensis]
MILSSHNSWRVSASCLNFAARLAWARRRSFGSASCNTRKRCAVWLPRKTRRCGASP